MVNNILRKKCIDSLPCYVINNNLFYRVFNVKIKNYSTQRAQTYSKACSNKCIY